jgi:phage/plasmid primase-like uncharacterized protein
MRTLDGDVRVQFDAALRARKLVPPKEVIADGEFHRCDARSNNGKGDGSYVVFADGVIPAGGFCNWQDGLGFEAWRYQPRGRPRTAAEDVEADKKVEEARKQREAQVAADHLRAAAKAGRLWEAAAPATAEHPYLRRKQVRPCGVRVLYNGAVLVVPARDAEGKVHTIQFIDADGGKRFLKGGAKQGHFFQIRGRDDVVYVAEGFATAATIHELTGCTVIIAFDGGNLEPVARTAHERFPGAEIVIAADDDWKREKEANPGLRHARAAASAVHGSIAVPEFGQNRRDKDTDFNDLATYIGADVAKSSLAATMTPDQCLERQLDADPFVALKDAIAKELADLKTRDRSAFAKLRQKLKGAGVRCALLDEAVEEQEEDDGEELHQKQVDVLLALVKNNDVELFHTEDKTAYATIAVDGHHETYPVGSTDFRDWLVHKFYKLKKSSPSSEAMASARMSVSARARFEGKRRNVYLRVAELDGKLYVDLCDDKWRCIEVSTAGWRICPEPPVRFRRKAGMLPLPVPTIGGSVDLLRPFLNLREGEDGDHEFVMLVSFLVTALSPIYPYPALAVTGVQGAAKSWTSELLRLLVDPNSVPKRVMPHDARSLYIQAQGSHVMCFNNISHIPTWISDALSCILDGDGFSVRALFTDSDEMLFGGAHPMVLNGIEDFLVRPDLAERTITITLHGIEEVRRREMKELRRRFDEARPLILGALLDIMAHGLKTAADGLTVGQLPRLADFARWSIACETACFHQGAFMAAFNRNREETTRIVLEADAVAQGVIALMKLYPEGWRGTATDLLGALKTVVGEETAKAKGWPKAANALSGRLRRTTPDLAKMGILISSDQVGHGKTRTLFISYATVPDKPDKSSSASSAATSGNDFNGLDADDNADDAGDATDETVRTADDADGHADDTSPAINAVNPLKGNGSGDADDADDDFPPYSAEPEHGCQQCNAVDGEVLKYRSDDGWVHLHAICRPFWLKAQRSAWR